MQGASAELALGRSTGAASAYRGRVGAAWRRLRRCPNLIVGGAVALLLLFVALAAPLVAPYDPLQLHPDVALSGPSTLHLLGTDQLGRDILSRVIYGTRISLRVGAAAMLFAVVFGVPFGLAAGYFSGWLDMLTMRLVDVMLSFPFLIFALLLIIVLGNGSQNVIIALGVGAVPLFCRLVRATVLSLSRRDYVQAALVVGASHRRIIFRHVLPNALSPIIIFASLLVAVSVIAEASLSYLGLGTQPPTPSWGLDLNKALGYLEVNLWMALGPGIAILITATAFNLLGDGLRDLLDPRLRNR
jgi:ABC-type dipeptide/oligopeptide/nickel transport system permease subunit